MEIKRFFSLPNRIKYNVDCVFFMVYIDLKICSLPPSIHKHPCIEEGGFEVGLDPFGENSILLILLSQYISKETSNGKFGFVCFHLKNAYRC